MKISEKLSQFTDTHAFLVVAGMHAGAIYHAHDGEVEKRESFEVSVPKYSDREGFYARGGKGGTYVSGAVKEVDKEEIQKQFIKDMAARLVKEINQYPKKSRIYLYLYAPQEILPHLRTALPNEVRRFVRDTFEGNHIHAQPPVLIGMLKKKNEDGVESLRTALAKPEAKKLLRKNTK